ncbi:hypothetical protein BDV59DRAFT_53488 [Aspergillus ambiguus]|uniref:uncharacterized protein n=1 Tax=Aspergillus ambiguus TaxID=176160 RepID=UPI003CCCC2BB
MRHGLHAYTTKLTWLSGTEPSTWELFGGCPTHGSMTRKGKKEGKRKTQRKGTPPKGGGVDPLAALLSPAAQRHSPTERVYPLTYLCDLPLPRYLETRSHSVERRTWVIGTWCRFPACRLSRWIQTGGKLGLIVVVLDELDFLEPDAVFCTLCSFGSGFASEQDYWM